MARRNGDDDPGSGRALRESWEEHQFKLLQGGYRRYADVLRDSLTQWAGERGYRWNEKEGQAFVHSMESWQPFPDTGPALRRAREAGLQLVIVSNSDRSIIEHTMRQLEVDFDDVIVAEDVKAYKPASRPFDLALSRIGVDPHRVVHVASRFSYDIAPASRLGLCTAWVNRARDERPGPEVPDFEWDSLWPLADVVG